MNLLRILNSSILYLIILLLYFFPYLFYPFKYFYIYFFMLENLLAQSHFSQMFRTKHPLGFFVFDPLSELKLVIVF